MHMENAERQHSKVDFDVETSREAKTGTTKECMKKGHNVNNSLTHM